MIDVAALGARLSCLTGEAYSISSFRPASTGYANTTWLVDAEPRCLAIKVQTSPACVYDRDPALEPAVLTALAATAVPVPLLVARDRGDSLFGSPWFATAFVDGVGLPDDRLAGYAQDGWFVDADPEYRTVIWNDFVDRLAHLHALPASTFGPTPRGGSHDRMIDYWTASLYEVLLPGEAPVQERALDWLEDNAPGDADATPDPAWATPAWPTSSSGMAVLPRWSIGSSPTSATPAPTSPTTCTWTPATPGPPGAASTGLPTAENTWRRWEQGSGLAATDGDYWQIFAASYMAITASRAMRLLYGFDPRDVEMANPFVPDIEAFIEEAAP